MICEILSVEFCATLDKEKYSTDRTWKSVKPDTPVTIVSDGARLNDGLRWCSPPTPIMPVEWREWADMPPLVRTAICLSCVAKVT